MKTVVYQSYRDHDVAPWLRRCMDSVRNWARHSNLDYHFSGDEIFSLLPDWYRTKAGTEICPQADLARLLLAQRLLAQGYDLAIWVDADVLVFQPQALQLALPRGFAFTHEIWTHLDENGKPALTHRVNNSVMLFARDNVHLGFFIDACLQIANAKSTLGKFDVGTDFLSRLRNILPFPLIENVGMLSPPLLADISQGDGPFLKAYGRALPRPLACANLCASLEHQEAAGISLEDVVNILLESRGDIINQHRL
ncbi:MAG TPA: hypothetical protein VF050_07620 [Moraxellaceae bacterium]